MSKKISNEEMCATLLSCGTIKDAANKLGVSERTIYNYMNDDAFMEMYDSAKEGIYNHAIDRLQNSITSAVECLIDLMEDKNNNPQIRLLAAQTVMKQSSNIMTERKNKGIFDF